MAKDPICNMEVDEQTSNLNTEVKHTIFAQKSAPRLRANWTPFCRN
jgi:hypothetical protein